MQAQKVYAYAFFIRFHCQFLCQNVQYSNNVTKNRSTYTLSMFHAFTYYVPPLIRLPLCYRLSNFIGQKNGRNFRFGLVTTYFFLVRIIKIIFEHWNCHTVNVRKVCLINQTILTKWNCPTSQAITLMAFLVRNIIESWIKKNRCA